MNIISTEGATMAQPEGRLPITTTTGPKALEEFSPSLQTPLKLADVPNTPLIGEACRDYPVLFDDSYADFAASAMKNVTEDIFPARKLAGRLAQATPGVRIPSSDLPRLTTAVLFHERVSRLKDYGADQYCYVAPAGPDAANSIFARVERLVERVEARMNGTEGTVSQEALSLKTCWNIARQNGLLTDDQEMERFQYLFKMHPRTAANQNGKGVYIVEAAGMPATVGEALDRLAATAGRRKSTGASLHVLRRQAFDGLDVREETATAFHRALLSDSRFERRKVGRKVEFSIKAIEEQASASASMPAQAPGKKVPRSADRKQAPAQHFVSEAQRESLRTLGASVMDRLLDGMVVTLHSGHIIATAEAVNGAPLQNKERHYLLGFLLTSHLTDMYPRSKDQRTIFKPNSQPEPIREGHGRSLELSGMSRENTDQLRKISTLLGNEQRTEE